MFGGSGGGGSNPDQQFIDAGQLVRAAAAKSAARPSQTLGTQNANVIYTDPTTGAKVYCGNIEAASNKEFHNSEKVHYIINCQEETSVNFHENNSNYRYYRFPITKWGCMMQGGQSRERVTDFFKLPFGWIDKALSEGHNCLIHCLAGAHRAGTTSVAFLMYKHGWTYPQALQYAQECRPIIGPFSWLIDMLNQYERELKSEGRIH